MSLRFRSICLDITQRFVIIKNAALSILLRDHAPRIKTEECGTPAIHSMKRLSEKKGLSAAPPGYAAAGDLLRVVCIFMVAWYHIWQQSWLSPVLTAGPVTLDFSAQVRAGYMFVDLMLLLSGFLTYLPYANGKKRGAADFYRRRALRILPSYWFDLLVMLVFSLADPEFSDYPRLGNDLLTHLTFTHNFFGFSYTATRMNVVLWTLAVEVQFYLILPGLARVFKKYPLGTYLAMVGAALAFRNLWTAPMEDTTLFVNRLPNMLDVYANGMLAAHLYVKLARLPNRRALVAALGTVAMAAAAGELWHIVRLQAGAPDYEALRHGQLNYRWLFSACGAVFLLGGSLSFRPVRWLCSNRLVRFLSGVSFNYYIWHQWLAVRLKEWRIPPYVSETMPQMAGEMPWQLHYTILCFVAALAAAILVTTLIEKPCARLGERGIENIMKKLTRKDEPHAQNP